MIKIIKEEIEIDESLVFRLNVICDFCNTTPTFINGSIHKVAKTNLSYIEPHKIIIKGITFLAFNYSNDIYIKDLYEHGIFIDDTIEDIKDDYTWNKENDKHKDKDDFDLEIY